MMPNLVNIGGVWRVLPPGIHDATMAEIRDSFTYNDIRQRLYEGFLEGAKLLKYAGCKTIYLDGSFVTEKSLPQDFDACWDVDNVHIEKLDPVFLEFSEGRKLQKKRFGGEFFPSITVADVKNRATFIEFFQQDRYSEKRKGIICIHLSKESWGGS